MALHQPRIQGRSMYRCEYCKVWLQDDPITKRIHNEGKKHKENIKLFLLEQQTKRVAAKKDEEKKEALLADLERKASLASSALLRAAAPPPPSGNPPAFAFVPAEDLSPPTLPPRPEAVRFGHAAYNACLSMGYLLSMSGGWPSSTSAESLKKRPRPQQQASAMSDPEGHASKKTRWGAPVAPPTATTATNADESASNSGFVYQDSFQAVEEPAEAAGDDGATEGAEEVAERSEAGTAREGTGSQQPVEAPALASADAAEWAAAEAAGEDGLAEGGDDAETKAALSALRTRMDGDTDRDRGNGSEGKGSASASGSWRKPTAAVSKKVSTASQSKPVATASVDTAVVQGVFRARPAEAGRGKRKKKKKMRGRKPL